MGMACTLSAKASAARDVSWLGLGLGIGIGGVLGLGSANLTLPQTLPLTPVLVLSLSP